MVIEMKHVGYLILCGISLLGACSSSNDNKNGGMANTPGAGAGTSAGGAGAGSGGTTSVGIGGNLASNASAGHGGSATTMGASGASVASAGHAGGAMMGASGAQSTGGAGSTQGQAGSPPAPGDVSRSAGCGMPAPMAGNLMIDVMGMSREYILALPANYDPMTAYKLVFAWHGLGGTAMQIASNWYGLKTMSANTVIFVAGQGLNTTNSVGSGPGWPNTNGQDVNFVKALYAQLQGQLCIDQNRVFSVGMSYGGIMSDTLGCQMANVFRAIAPMSGSGPGFGGRATCMGQVAVWLSNGDNDTVVPTAQERASRDFWVGANHCQMQSMPTDPSPCVAYQGCDAGYPVTWCEFAGGHTVPPFAASAIWKFFSQF
jgi:poly(3-hydroxybutyrate) depolymerase